MAEPARGGEHHVEEGRGDIPIPDEKERKEIEEKERKELEKRRVFTPQERDDVISNIHQIAFKFFSGEILPVQKSVWYKPTAAQEELSGELDPQSQTSMRYNSYRNNCTEFMLKRKKDTFQPTQFSQGREYFEQKFLNIVLKLPIPNKVVFPVLGLKILFMKLRDHSKSYQASGLLVGVQHFATLIKEDDPEKKCLEILQKKISVWFYEEEHTFWKDLAESVTKETFTRGEQLLFLNYLKYLCFWAEDKPFEWDVKEKVECIDELVKAFKDGKSFCSAIYTAAANINEGRTREKKAPIPRSVMSDCCQIALTNITFPKFDEPFLFQVSPPDGKEQHDQVIEVADEDTANNMKSKIKGLGMDCIVNTIQKIIFGDSKGKATNVGLTYSAKEWKGKVLGRKNPIHIPERTIIVNTKSDSGVLEQHIIPSLQIFTTDEDAYLKARDGLFLAIPGVPITMGGSEMLLEADSNASKNMFDAIFSLLENFSFASSEFGPFIAGGLSFIQILFGGMFSSGDGLIKALCEAFHDVIEEEKEEERKNVIKRWSDMFSGVGAALQTLCFDPVTQKYTATPTPDKLKSDDARISIFVPLEQILNPDNALLKVITDLSGSYYKEDLKMYCLATTLYVVQKSMYVQLTKVKDGYKEMDASFHSLGKFIKDQVDAVKSNIQKAKEKRLDMVTNVNDYSHSACSRYSEVTSFYYFEDKGTDDFHYFAALKDKYTSREIEADKRTPADTLVKALRETYIEKLKKQLDDELSDINKTVFGDESDKGLKSWVKIYQQWLEGSTPLAPQKAPIPLEKTGVALHDPASKSWKDLKHVAYSISYKSAFGESQITMSDYYDTTKMKAFPDLEVDGPDLSGNYRMIYRTFEEISEGKTMYDIKWELITSLDSDDKSKSIKQPHEIKTA